MEPAIISNILLQMFGQLILYLIICKVRTEGDKIN